MKLCTLIRIAITSSVALLCTGFAMYSYFKLSAVDSRKDFNLYTLVPPTASAVFETDDFAAFIQEVDALECSKSQQFLHISKLFTYLKSHLYALLDNSPHGLSRRMNKVLFSFHEPYDDRSQILYCMLGKGDYERVEAFVRKYISPSYPYKKFDYKGEDIRIYPMADGDFLACYLTSDFLVISYQKRLIETVIDARLSGRSLAKDPSFMKAYKPNKNMVSAAVYSRMRTSETGAPADVFVPGFSFKGWMEFDMKLKNSLIYCSGICHDADTCFTFVDVTGSQQPVEGFPGDIVPVGTFLLTKRSVTDWTSILKFLDRLSVGKSKEPEPVYAQNKAFARYLAENGKSDLTTCIFLKEDTTFNSVAVASLSLNDVLEAESLLRKFISESPKETDKTSGKTITFCYTSSRAYPVYTLPRNTLFAQLTGMSGGAMHVYATFYEGRLLLASDADGLSYYIHHLEKGEVVAGTSGYEAGISGLANSYNFMMMTDFAGIFSQPENYGHLMPDFFFHNADFFRHFILSVQFVCTEGTVYPNLVLFYKGD